MSSVEKRDPCWGCTKSVMAHSRTSNRFLVFLGLAAAAVASASLAWTAYKDKAARGAGTELTVENQTSAPTTVYVSFGADSKITASDWSSFCTGAGLSCSFPLGASGKQPLPNPKAAYLNATFAFGAPVGCGVTKAEVNVNNPTWYDTLDVSLVDGYSNNVKIAAAPSGAPAVELGPPAGAVGNQEVYGLFPVGCDICVERQNPPCGMAKGKHGCKKGTQYDPAVPCQWQGPAKGGGGTAAIVLVP